ncbi:hypothetical protein M501DRAFT_995322 [Patellaria atrata CBS 101060]|uniref:HECT-type E3 ubiquitin transferase n=1 Tax=Patellaria atrata CBS 101060 TaxID=1346257 RepID=A0A9P4VN65_9PEZI|nr:hypothetical protein M501DRAFT_995322 [Patellaria atrata CBS 101060]
MDRRETPPQTDPAVILRTILGEKVSDCLVNAVVLETPDEKNLDQYHILRQAVFQHYVNKFFLQLRYGCEEKYCTTPTCFSCRKRMPNVPVRRPTILSSRSLAYYLASQNNPGSLLCPHAKPFVDHGNCVEQDGNDNKQRRPELSLVSLLVVGLRTARNFALMPGQTNKVNKHLPYLHFGLAPAFFPNMHRRGRVRVSDTPHSHSLSDQDQVQPLEISSTSVVQTRIDSKSLTQMLFNTSSLKRFQYVPPRFLLEQSQGVIEAISASSHLRLFDLGLSAINSEHAVTEGLLSSQFVLRSSYDEIFSLQDDNEDVSSGTAVHGNSVLGTSPLTGPLERSRPVSNLERRTSVQSQTETGAIANHRLSIKSLNLDATTSNSHQMILPALSTSHLTSDVMLHLRALRLSNSLSACYWEPRGMSLLGSQDLHPQSPQDAFVDRSLFHTLANPKILLQSFRGEIYSDPSLEVSAAVKILNPHNLVTAFSCWTNVNGSLIFDSLWQSLKVLFNPPPGLSLPKSKRSKSLHQGTSDPLSTGDSDMRVDDADAAHIAIICIYALTSLIRTLDLNQSVYIRQHRAMGLVFKDTDQDPSTLPFLNENLSMRDGLEYEPALRLADQLVRALAARKCFSEIAQTTGGKSADVTASTKQMSNVMSIIIHHFQFVEQYKNREFGFHLNLIPFFLDWLRAVILKHWDGKALVNRWSETGGAIEIMSNLYESREILYLTGGDFPSPFIDRHFDLTDIAADFMRPRSNPNYLHVLSFPFLSAPSTTVSIFRVFNHTTMLSHYQETKITQQSRLHPFTGVDFTDFESSYTTFLDERLKSATLRYLVLEVRRKHLLEDTFNQLMYREKRLLLRPLKVRIGTDQGEAGVDQGGVSQEFFRLAFAEAMNPENGMFTVDPETRMTWFQPASMQPLRYFELIGLLMSLAVYNGITIPLSFPLAFYSRLLGDHFRKLFTYVMEGWPSLARGLLELRHWSNGDVSDTFARTYDFSFDAFGQPVNIDMERFRPEGPLPWEDENFDAADWSQLSEDSVMVTNENRLQFIADYTEWLLERSIAPQYEAFTRGFFTCIDKTALSLFTPEKLRDLVEGHREIDVNGLMEVTQYEDGYSPTSPFIQMFWSVVLAYDQEQVKRLLEFVTASDRVPVNGIRSISFCIIRNGGDNERVPTSMTCFGKLLLPEYSSREKLEEKLKVALENSKGFGSM